MAWLTRFGGVDKSSTTPGIAYQGSLSPVPLEMNVGDMNIASPAAALVVSPRTAVTSAQQAQNVSATLPIMQPGQAPGVATNQTPNADLSKLLVVALLIGGVIFFSRMR